tara:strand:- start:146 stop:454 length:309 start_codon:yes stop_codon:yes gene_type:complete
VYEYLVNIVPKEKIMFKWLKRVMGYGTVESVIEMQFPSEPRKLDIEKTVTKKVSPKKVASKKKAVDLSTMKKDELLAHAKKSKVKVNASMKKADIIKAISAA